MSDDDGKETEVAAKFKDGDSKPEVGHKAFHSSNYKWNVLGCRCCDSIQLVVFLPAQKIPRLGRDLDFIKLWSRIMLRLDIERLSICPESDLNESNYLCIDCDSSYQEKK